MNMPLYFRIKIVVFLLLYSVLGMLAQNTPASTSIDPIIVMAQAEKLLAEEKYDEAQQTLDHSRELSNINKMDKNVFAKLFYLYSRVTFAKSNYGAAYTYANTAIGYLPLADQLPDDYKKTIKYELEWIKGKIDADNERYELAKIALNKVIEDAIKRHDPLREAEAQLALANLYTNFQEFDFALLHFNKAIKLIEKRSHSIEGQTLLAEIYKELGMLYLAKKDQLESVNNLIKAQFNANLIGSYTLISSVQLGLGEAFALANLQEESLDLLSQGLSQNLANYTKDEVLAWLQMGRIYENMTKKMPETDYFILASKGYTPTTESILISQSKTASAMIFGPQLTRALASYNKALNTVNNEKNPRKRNILKIDALMAKGRILLNAKLSNEAQAIFEEALALAKAIYSENSLIVSECYAAISSIAIEQKNYESAIAQIDKAIQSSIGQSVTDSMTTEKLEKAIPTDKLSFEIVNALIIKAKAQFEQAKSGNKIQDAKKSMLLFEATLLLVNKLRRQHRTQGERFALGKLLTMYSNYAFDNAQFLYEKDNKTYITLAFKYSELSRSISLTEALKDLEAKKVAGIPLQTLSQERFLKMELATYETNILQLGKLSDPSVPAKLVKLQSRKLQTEKKLYNFLDSLEKVYPNYYKLKYNYTPTTIATLQNNLSDKTLVIELFLTESHTNLFLITKDKAELINFKLDKIDSRNSIINLLKAIQENDYKNFCDHSYKIYQKILQPVESQINKANRLIFIPDDEYNYIPFEVLLTQKPTQPDGDFRKLEYLIRSKSISYNYSAGFLIQGQKTEQHQTPTKGCMAISPVFTDSTYLKADKYASNRKAIEKLSPLPGAQKEINILKSIFAGDAYNNKDATEENFKNKSDQYSLIHIATHSIMNNTNPLNSKLVFSQPDKISADNDGILHAYELYGMELNAQLITLSACNSGIGTIEEGEGVLSLARAFAFAGTPNIVMSLWALSDYTTAQIIETFYQKLNTNTPKDEAMQEAKLRFLESATRVTSAPAYWAGLVIIGNHEKIDLSKLKKDSNSNYLNYILLAILLLILIFLANVFLDKIQKNKQINP